MTFTLIRVGKRHGRRSGVAVHVGAVGGGRCWLSASGRKTGAGPTC
jgi:hypothetical protein